MSILTMVKIAGNFVADHSAEIVSGLAIATTVVTSITSAKAGSKMKEPLAEAKEYFEENPEIPKREKVAYYVGLFAENWRTWTPAAISVVATCGLIVASNKISLSKQSALAAMIVSSQQLVAKYQDSIKEVLDDDKADEITRKVSEKLVKEAPTVAEGNLAPRNQTIVVGSGEHLCFEPLSGRYFRGSREGIREAINSFNEEVLHEDAASVNDLFRYLGLDDIVLGDDLGWNSDRLVEVNFIPDFDPDGNPVLAISYAVPPRTGRRNHFRG